MSRTYWEKKPDGTLEFLGAFTDGHKVKDPKQPQGRGVVIDITDKSIEGVLEALSDRVLLVGLPSAITKRIAARMSVTVPWAQLEGFVR